MSRITVEEIDQLCRRELPWAVDMNFRIVELERGACRVRLPYEARYVRPGGTVSGPAMMSLADFAMYVAVLSAIGPVELAVTINFSINFLRRPQPADLLAHARLLKLGKRLAVGEVALYSEGEDEAAPVAHVTSTYSIPPQDQE